MTKSNMLRCLRFILITVTSLIVLAIIGSAGLMVADILYINPPGDGEGVRTVFWAFITGPFLFCMLLGLAEMIGLIPTKTNRAS